MTDDRHDMSVRELWRYARLDEGLLEAERRVRPATGGNGSQHGVDSSKLESGQAQGVVYPDDWDASDYAEWSDSVNARQEASVEHTCNASAGYGDYTNGPCEACAKEKYEYSQASELDADQWDADYAASFGVSETVEAICLNCQQPFKLHEGWQQHGSSLRCPIVMSDILVGFHDTKRWSFGGTQQRGGV